MNKIDPEITVESKKILERFCKSENYVFGSRVKNVVITILSNALQPLKDRAVEAENESKRLEGKLDDYRQRLKRVVDLFLPFNDNGEAIWIARTKVNPFKERIE